jgi:hypothetical protein
VVRIVRFVDAASEARKMQAGCRWNYRRKAALLDAIAAGQIDEAAGCEKYGLSPEELAEWRRKYVPGQAASLKINQTSPRVLPRPETRAQARAVRRKRRAGQEVFSQADAEEVVPGKCKTPKGYG